MSVSGLASIRRAEKSSPPDVGGGLFQGSPAEVRSSSRANIRLAPAGGQEIPPSPWRRQAPASEWRQSSSLNLNCDHFFSLPTPSLLLFPCKSNESLPFSFESCYELRSDTGYDRAFGASISPSWSITSHSAALQTDFLRRRRPLQIYHGVQSHIHLASSRLIQTGL